jgi:hypothetical protein
MILLFLFLVFCIFIFGVLYISGHVFGIHGFDLIYFVKRYFQQYFSYIMATSFSGERSRRGPPTTGVV